MKGGCIDKYFYIFIIQVILMIKAIFFDIDGTLVSFKTHKVPQSTIDALNLLRKKGIKIYFLDGDNFFTSTQLLHFTEYTVDGVHPTDLGSSLIAEGYYQKIVKVLDNE